jgi:hypothetical protein
MGVSTGLLILSDRLSGRVIICSTGVICLCLFGSRELIWSVALALFANYVEIDRPIFDSRWLQAQTKVLGFRPADDTN